MISPKIDKAAWLAARRTGISASEAASVLGLNRYEGPLDVYARKIGDAPENEMTDAMEMGLLLEAPIQELYERRTGRKIVETQVFIQRQYFGGKPGEPTDESKPVPLSATLDGITDAGPILEIKTVGLRNRAMTEELGEIGTDQIPESWLIQVQQQLLVSERQTADVAVLIGGQEFRIYTVEANVALQGVMVEQLAEFWRRVSTRSPPPLVHPVHPRILAALNPECDGEIELDAETMDWANCYTLDSLAIKSAEKRKEELKSKILARMGKAKFGVLPDGRRIQRYVIDVPEATSIKKAHRRHYFAIKDVAKEPE